MTGKIKQGSVRPSIELLQTFTKKFVEGLVATSGIGYSAVATFGTTAVDILTKSIETGGLDLQLYQIEVGLTQEFDNLIASSVGSLTYYWQMRTERVATTRDWVNIAGTYTKGIGTSGVAADDPVEDTFSGYIPIGSIPESPIGIKLTAIGLVGDSISGRVKNSSYVKLIGTVIPGA